MLKRPLPLIRFARASLLVAPLLMACGDEPDTPPTAPLLTVDAGQGSTTDSAANTDSAVSDAVDRSDVDSADAPGADVELDVEGGELEERSTDDVADEGPEEGGAESGPEEGGAESGPDAFVDGPVQDLEIIGSWEDVYGIWHIITNTEWAQSTPDQPEFDSLFLISQYSNAERWVVAQNDVNHPWNPLEWSRFDWTVYANHFWYCQTTWTAATEAEALTTPPADPTEPYAGGCGTGAWSLLLPSP